MSQFNTATVLMSLDEYNDLCVKPAKQKQATLSKCENRTAARFVNYKEIDKEKEEDANEQEHGYVPKHSINELNRQQLDYEAKEFNQMYVTLETAVPQLEDMGDAGMSQVPTHLAKGNNANSQRRRRNPWQQARFQGTRNRFNGERTTSVQQRLGKTQHGRPQGGHYKGNLKTAQTMWGNYKTNTFHDVYQANNISNNVQNSNAQNSNAWVTSNAMESLIFGANNYTPNDGPLTNVTRNNPIQISGIETIVEPHGNRNSLRLADLMNINKDSTSNIDTAEVARNAQFLLNTIIKRKASNTNRPQRVNFLENHNMGSNSERALYPSLYNHY